MDPVGVREISNVLKISTLFLPPNPSPEIAKYARFRTPPSIRPLASAMLWKNL